MGWTWTHTLRVPLPLSGPPLCQALHKPLGIFLWGGDWQLHITHLP